MSRFAKGHKWPPIIEAKRIASLKGRKHSDETKRKIGEANKKRKHLSGSEAPNWQGGKITKKCLVCNRKFKIFSYRKNARFCSRECTNKGIIRKGGREHPNWKGGKQKSGNGYTYLHMPNHPFADKRGRVFEHRATMEKLIGRYLRLGEIVHHINKNNSDNKPGNLKLYNSNGEHIKMHFIERR